MKRPNPFLLSAIASIVTSFTLLSATTSTANAAPAGGFKATPVAAVEDSRLVVRDSLWRCDADNCWSTTKSASRAAFVCESLVKEIGAVSAFRAGTEEFDATALAKCNARAKTSGETLARAD